MAQNENYSTVDLRVGTEAQFNAKVDTLPAGALFGVTDATVSKADLSTDLKNEINDKISKPANPSEDSIISISTNGAVSAKSFEVYVGQDLPTGNNVRLWINPSDDDKIIEYGIRWTVGQSSPTGERRMRIGGVEQAWDITYTPNVGSVNYNAFDSIDLFNPQIVTDDFGNKFSRFSKFYWAKETIGNYEYIWVCKAKLNSNYNLPRAFKDYGAEWTYVDIGCYKASSEVDGSTTYLCSKSGKTVLSGTARTNFYNYAKNNNTRSGLTENAKYLITTMSEWNEIIMPLMMIVYGTRNTQSIYRGVCDFASAESNKQPTGLTDDIKSNSGTESNDGKHSFKFMNIENIYGDTWTNILDCTIKDNKSYVCTNLNNWSDVDPTTNSSFEAVSYTNATSNGYVKTMGWDSNHPDIQITTEIGGSSTAYYSDYYYQATGVRTTFVGGVLNDGSGAGLFYWILSGGLGSADWSIGGRLSRRVLMGG